jgi:hypothetical protein
MWLAENELVHILNHILVELVTHQQTHYLLNLEGLNFTLEFT